METIWFVDREEELQQLRSFYLKAKNGDGQFVLIRGQDGSGKTTLVEEFLRQLRIQDSEEFLLGWYLSLGRDIVLDRLTTLPKEILPAFLELNAWIKYQDLLESQSQQAPLILVLDDLHRADSTVLNVFLQLGSRNGFLSGHRILLIGTYVEPAQDANFNQFVNGIYKKYVPKSPDNEPLDLGPISIKTYLSKRYPGANFRKTFLEELETRIGGDPLFLDEFCRLWEEEKRIFKQPTQIWVIQLDNSDFSSIPLGIKDCLERRIALFPLDSQERRFLEDASILAREGREGLQFTAEVLAKMNRNQPLDEILVGLNKLVTHGWLQEIQPATRLPGEETFNYYVFTHRIHRDFIYPKHDANRGRYLHRQAARALLDNYQEIIDTRPDIQFQLGRHYEIAQLWRDAFQYSYGGARWKWRIDMGITQAGPKREYLDLTSSNARENEYGIQDLLGEYIRVLTLAVNCGESGIPYQEAGSLLYEFGKLLERAGRAQDALKCYLHARRYVAPDRNLQAQMLAGQLWSLCRSVHSDTQIRELVQEANDMLLILRDSREKAEIHNAIGGAFFIDKRYIEAEREFKLAQEQYKMLDEQAELAAMMINCGMAFWEQGKLTEAEIELRNALELKSRLQHNYGVANARANLALILAAQGRIPDSISTYIQALESFQASGNEYDLAMGEGNLGELYIQNLPNIPVEERSEQLTQAFTHLDNALDMYEHIRDPEGPPEVIRVLKDIQEISGLSHSSDFYPLSTELEKRRGKLMVKAEHILKSLSGAARLENDLAAKSEGDPLIEKLLSELHVSEPDTNSPVPITAKKILIVTVTKVEAQAVLQAYSWELSQNLAVIGRMTYYKLGIHGGAEILMAQSEMGSATPGGALLTVRQAIQDLRPIAVIMCGIAFGLRPGKQELGDILVSKQLLSYEPQKLAEKRGRFARGDRVTASELLLSRCRVLDNFWQGANTHIGMIMSGEKLVNDPKFRDSLLEIEPEAIGGEMEGAGLYAAARDANTNWILIKAICDWADGNKKEDAQPVAAQNAAEFVKRLIETGGWDQV